MTGSCGYRAINYSRMYLAFVTGKYTPLFTANIQVLVIKCIIIIGSTHHRTMRLRDFVVAASLMNGIRSENIGANRIYIRFIGWNLLKSSMLLYLCARRYSKIYHVDFRVWYYFVSINLFLPFFLACLDNAAQFFFVSLFFFTSKGSQMLEMNRRAW